jgi:hypothetical protein
MVRTLVTTSWDDGHPFDLRTAERLCSHRLKGTFYVTAVSSKRARMSLGEVRELLAMGMEIGRRTRALRSPAMASPCNFVFLHIRLRIRSKSSNRRVRIL